MARLGTAEWLLNRACKGTVKRLSSSTTIFPNLDSKTIPWDDASDPTDDYNCMGLAVGVLRWWSPPDAPGCVRNPRDFWPASIKGDGILVSAFVEAAGTVGFETCDNAEW